MRTVTPNRILFVCLTLWLCDNAHAQTQRVPARAIQSTRSLIAPSKAQMHAALISRGIAHATRREYKDAVSVFTEALKLDPESSNDHFFRGKIYGLLGETKKAIDDLTASIKFNKTNAYAYLERGKIYYAAGNFKSALTDLTEAVKMLPNDSSAHECLGAAMNALGKNTEAIGEITTALALVQVKPPISRESYIKKHFGEVDVELFEKEKARLLRLRAKVNFDKKDYATALTDQDYSIKLDQSSFQTFLDRAKTNARLNQKDRAMADLDRATKMARSKPVYLKASDIYMELGEKEKADEVFALANGDPVPKQQSVETPALPKETPTATTTTPGASSETTATPESKP